MGIEGSTASSSWLVGGGEMGKFIRSMDWSRTPLGPIDAWPQSLRTTVGLCLSSNFPINILWGPQQTQIYNDGYWPICGNKHPHSMGMSFPECWASAMPAIGDAFRRGLAGEAAFLEDQRMFLDRLGYLEETFFTFSFSPIRDESGQIAGLFHPVTETTGKMLAERRARTLRDVAACAGRAQSLDESLAVVAQTLAAAHLDLPFALFYRLDAAGQRATLAAHTGLPPDGPATPAAVDLTHPSTGWPLAEARNSSQAIQLEDIRERFPGMVCDPYPEPIQRAFILPVSPPGAEQATCLLVVGTSVRLPMTETYRAFIDLLAAAVSPIVASAIAYEVERERVEALAAIDRAKTTFFSNVSHEFRTPLTLILGPLEDELSQSGEPMPRARRERLEAAHRNSLRLLKLVNTLLEFSRIEAGRMEAVFEPTNLASLTAELASNFRSACEMAGLQLVIDCEALPEPVFIDRDMWEKIVLNLLSNAFKFTLHGQITVGLKPSGNKVMLSVRDTGVGIPSKELHRLFERFYRPQGTAGRSVEGSGIGLALVRELVLLHGGSIDVESTHGEGSSFVVTIPLGNAHLPVDRLGNARTQASTALGAAPYVEEAKRWLVQAPAPGEESLGELEQEEVPSQREAAVISAAPEESSAHRRERIVWADDNADMRAYVRGLLADRFEVEAVVNGADALMAVRRELPDLVLTDVMMPQLDGFGLLRELRADERTRTVPVILLSARAGEESRLEGLAAGADDYLVKPFGARELLARVEAAIRLAQVRNEAHQQLSHYMAQLERSNQELDQFAYAASHDLKEPLRKIGSFAQIIAQNYADRMDAAGLKYLGIMVDAAKRMQVLIDDILSYARLGREDVPRRQVDMNALVRGVLSDLEIALQDVGAQVEVTSLPAVLGDPSQLRQLWQNLISNALKYRQPEQAPSIHVGSDYQGGKPRFWVRDNGIGIDPRHFDRIFGVFQRLHSRDEYPGTGIGLAVCKKIVTNHGGAIWVESIPGRGTTFYFTLEEKS